MTAGDRYEARFQDFPQDLRTARFEGFFLLTGFVTAGAGKGRPRDMFSDGLGRQRPDKGTGTQA